MTTYVFFKSGADTSETLNLPLQAGEQALSIVQQPVTPTDANTLQALAVLSGAQLLLTLSQGTPGVTYGVPFVVQTNVRTIEVTAAVAVGSDVFVPYRAQDPDSYTDLLGTIENGQAALSTSLFTLPLGLDPAGGNVQWELLDDQGVVYSAGNAFDFKIQNNGLAIIVISKSIVTVPSDTPPSIDRPYQIRYTLTIPSVVGEQTKFYSYENVTVTGLEVIPLGTVPSVELQGDDATVSIVLDKAYSDVAVELYQDNTLIASSPITNPTRVSSGYYFGGTFSTAQLPVSLVPYRVVWKYKMGNSPTFRESTSLWVINPSILSAVEDCQAKINKARTTLYGTQDTQFSPETLMTWLRRGADSFNGSYGVFTAFTFTNAKGGIRDYWLMYAEMMAIESQYLAEGEKAFNFQGSNISLDVDRTQFLDSAASKIQQRLDNEFKMFKQNLVMRGCTTGDGSADPTKLQKGAIGAVGISISPASPWGSLYPLSPFRRLL